MVPIGVPCVRVRWRRKMNERRKRHAEEKNMGWWQHSFLYTHKRVIWEECRLFVHTLRNSFPPFKSTSHWCWSSALKIQQVAWLLWMQSIICRRLELRSQRLHDHLQMPWKNLQRSYFQPGKEKLRRAVRLLLGFLLVSVVENELSNCHIWIRLIHSHNVC